MPVIRMMEDTGEQHETTAKITVEPSALPSETLRFDGPFECKYLTVDHVEFERSAASLHMKVQYTMRSELPAEFYDEIPEVLFKLADPTGQRDFRTREYQSLDWTNRPANSDKYGDFGSPEAPPTDTYIEETVWPALQAWPESFELYPSYRGLGERDEPLTLKPGDVLTAKP